MVYRAGIWEHGVFKGACSDTCPGSAVALLPAEREEVACGVLAVGCTVCVPGWSLVHCEDDLELLLLLLPAPQSTRIIRVCHYVQFICCWDEPRAFWMVDKHPSS